MREAALRSAAVGAILALLTYVFQLGWFLILTLPGGILGMTFYAISKNQKSKAIAGIVAATSFFAAFYLAALVCAAVLNRFWPLREVSPSQIIKYDNKNVDSTR